MNVRNMSLEDLELLSYTDIAYELLKIDKSAKTTPELFGEICTLLKIDENQMLEMIADFYTTLTTDKRFILLDNSKWDLKELHKVNPIIDDEDEEEIPEEESDEEQIEGTEDEAVAQEEDEYAQEDDDDSLDDLAIISDEEMEE